MGYTDELANLLKPILAINAEDKQKIKELTAENEEFEPYSCRIHTKVR